jgi:hypothetical protein
MKARLGLVLIPSLALAGPEAKPASPTATGPHIATVSATVGTCSNDNGKLACPAGVKYLADVIGAQWTFELTNKPVACAADVKPGAFTFSFSKSVSDDSETKLDDDVKAQAKWPACVKDFSASVTKKWLEWQRALQSIDERTQVGSSYKVTVTVIELTDAGMF